MAGESVEFARHGEVLWRLAPDRVLVRRLWPMSGRDEAADLLGMAALTWMVLDEPGTLTDVVDRLSDVELADQASITEHATVDALDQLVAAGWLVVARAEAE